MSQKPLVSMVLISYNQQQFIREAVQSALDQTYSPLEIIISDDASMDNTFEIIREMAASYNGPHQVIINRNETNLGLVGNLNRAVAKSKGEWILAAAGDDISLSHRCECLVKATSRCENVKAISSSCERIDQFGNELENIIPERFINNRCDTIGQIAWIRRFIKGDDIGVHGATCLWHRSLFDIYGEIPNKVPAEDAVLSFRAYLEGSVCYISDILVKYRLHSSNIYSGANMSYWDHEMKSQKFSQKSIESSHAIQSDLLTYKKIHGNTIVAQNAHKLIKWSYALQFKRANWWSMPFFWKIQQCMISVIRLNFNELKWSLKRSFGRKFFEYISKF